MIIDGERVEINPAETDLPDRCKLVVAEAMTGQKFKLVKRYADVRSADNVDNQIDNAIEEIKLNSFFLKQEKPQ